MGADLLQKHFLTLTTLIDFRLSGCLVTEEGCAALAHALSCNPFHLKELDLSYNYPGDQGTKQLTAALQNPRLQLTTLRYGDRIRDNQMLPIGGHFSSGNVFSKLEKGDCIDTRIILSLEHGGIQRLKPGQRKCKWVFILGFTFSVYVELLIHYLIQI